MVVDGDHRKIGNNNYCEGGTICEADANDDDDDVSFVIIYFKMHTLRQISK